MRQFFISAPAGFFDLLWKRYPLADSQDIFRIECDLEESLFVVNGGSNIDGSRDIWRITLKDYDAVEFFLLRNTGIHLLNTQVVNEFLTQIARSNAAGVARADHYLSRIIIHETEVY